MGKMSTDQHERGFSLFDAFLCACHGIQDTAKERNFRIELCFMVLCIVLGFAFGISILEWLTVIVCFGLVLGGECFNTSIEAIVDLVSPDYHELARIAKDAAAGAVMLFSIASFIVGAIIFLPRILTVLQIL